MFSHFPKSSQVDIMLFSEGTYPYIKGGVSSWILQLMKGLPEFTFGVCFIGATPYVNGKKMEVCYEFPPNLKHLEVHYLFDKESEQQPTPQKIKGSKTGFQAIRKLYASLTTQRGQLPKMLQNIDFYLQDVTFEDFLYSEEAWRFINELAMKNAPDIPFIDYFWTVRNIHRPIWILAKIVKHLPQAKIYHAPSTGYAGFLGALSSYTTQRPFILTEHGIYTRERKIDMLSADWIEYKKPALLQQPEEYNYIKKMWVDFFDKIGLFCYYRANHIFSLYQGAQKIQIALGAPKERCEIIPNGVDVDGLMQTIQLRQDPPRPIITLIGRVVPIKDIKTFIRAIKIASQHIPDIEGWIVGAVDEDVEYVLECQQMAISLDLKFNLQTFHNNKATLSLERLVKDPDKIKFFGHQNIKEILPKSALQTLTSISEGMPLVILEGFAAGVPCVATDVGSCRDLIEGGLNEDDKQIGLAGAVTSIANPEALAQEYVKFLDFQNGTWKKAQENALTRVQKYYKEEMFLEDYRKIYKEALLLTYDELKKKVFAYYAPNKLPYPKIKVKRGELSWRA
jgi:glycosyltransferase involved in cell wall biosynthesis